LGAAMHKTGALKSLIFELNDSAFAFVFRFTKKLRIWGRLFLTVFDTVLNSLI